MKEISLQMIGRRISSEWWKKLYDKIYKNGRLTYEIETFYEDGRCEISYYRAT